MGRGCAYAFFFLQMAKSKSEVSLQELIDYYHLSQSQLNAEISDEHLTEVSRIVGDHEMLGHELKLTSENMVEVKQAKTLELQKLAMLTKWKQRSCWKAKYCTLIEALLKCGRADCATDMCKLLTQSEYGNCA